MPFHTRITEMLGIEHPIVQGGMQSVGVAELASAVSNAGGLGILTALTQPTPAERKGVDIISIDGFECAGHPGEDDIPGLILIPAAADKVKIPMLASGGFGDGRGLVAALSLGAEGINMGTRFCATVEAPIHPNVKQKYIENDERGSHLIFRNFHNTARVGKSDVSDEVVRRLKNPDATFEDVRELVSGVAGKELLETGDLSKGVFWAGMVQGLIHDIPTCAQLIDRIIAEAEAILDDRLAAMRRPAQQPARVA